MADHCSFCDTHRPEGGTNHLILNVNGSEDSWLEFCKPCGEKETMTNAAGETYTVVEIFNGLPKST